MCTFGHSDKINVPTITARFDSIIICTSLASYVTIDLDPLWAKINPELSNEEVLSKEER